MKKRSSGTGRILFNLRIVFEIAIGSAGILLALLSWGGFFKASAKAAGQTQPSPGPPDVIQMVGPVRTTTDVSHLPYIPNEGEREERPLTRYPRGTGQTGASADYGTSGLAYGQGLLKVFCGQHPPCRLRCSRLRG